MCASFPPAVMMSLSSPCSTASSTCRAHLHSSHGCVHDPVVFVVFRDARGKSLKRLHDSSFGNPFHSQSSSLLGKLFKAMSTDTLHALVDLADGNKDGLLQPSELAALVAKPPCRPRRCSRQRTRTRTAR